MAFEARRPAADLCARFRGQEPLWGSQYDETDVDRVYPLIQVYRAWTERERHLRRRSLSGGYIVVRCACVIERQD